MTAPKDPSYLLGQLVGTAQCLQEALKEKEHEDDNHLTWAEEYFNDMIEEPATTLKHLEDKLEPFKFKFAHLDEEKMLRDMQLIYKLKNTYNITDEHLDEEEYFKGYQSQVKRFFEEHEKSLQQATVEE